MNEWISNLNLVQSIADALDQYEANKENLHLLAEKPVADQGAIIFGRYLSAFLEAEASTLGAEQCFNFHYDTLDRLPVALSVYVRNEKPTKEYISKTLACIFYGLAIMEHGCAIRTVRTKGATLSSWEGDLSLKLGKKREIDFLPAAKEALALPISVENGLFISLGALSKAYYSAIGVDLNRQYGIAEIMIPLEEGIQSQPVNQPKDDAQPMTLEESIRLAPYGNVTAMTNLALAYLEGTYGLKKDLKQAKYWYDRLAEMGDRDAMFNLGILYERGLGCSRDFEKSKEWFIRARDAGDDDASSFVENINTIYDCNKAAKEGDASAQAEIAEAYMALGNGIKNGDKTADFQEGIRWARKAANNGNAKAMWLLGLCYEKGRGVTADKAQAVQWYRQGAELGHTGAQTNLGCMYGRGDGVPKNEEIAMEWIRRAAEAGNEAAINILKQE